MIPPSFGYTRLLPCEIVAALALATLTLSGWAGAFSDPVVVCQSPTAVYPDPATLGEPAYAPAGLGGPWVVCSEQYVDNVDALYGTDESTWNASGWHSACDPNQFYQKFMMGDTVLRVSTNNYWTAGDTFHGGALPAEFGAVLDSVATLVHYQADDIRADCLAEDSAKYSAATDWWGDITLNKADGFFFWNAVPLRASTLFHEVAHIYGDSHIKVDGQPERDPAFDPAKMYTQGYVANVAFLTAYAESGVNAPPGMKCLAQRDADARLATRFVTVPPAFAWSVDHCLGI